MDTIGVRSVLLWISNILNFNNEKCVCLCVVCEGNAKNTKLLMID